MKQGMKRLGLLALLAGGVLGACGVPPEEAMAPSEENLGTRQQALCSGTAVGGLTLLGVSSWYGEVAGSGDWAVTGGANAARLEYRVDGVLRVVDERLGQGDAWYFSTTGISCGTHTFQVTAYPMVVDSAGNRTTCLDAPVSQSASFTDTSCMCVIGGTNYRDGKVNPASACQICDISQSTTSWSFNPGGIIDKKGSCKFFPDGHGLCINSGFKNGLACTASSQCYTTCAELL